MIAGFLTLLLCQLLGQFIAQALNLPVPGPVIGMVNLLIILLIRRPKPTAGVIRVADGLLSHLQLLFIPAGAGLIAYLHLIRAQWLPIIAGILLSWLITLAVTAGAGTGMLKLQTRFHKTKPTPAAPDLVKAGTK